MNYYDLKEILEEYPKLKEYIAKEEYQKFFGILYNFTQDGDTNHDYYDSRDKFIELFDKLGIDWQAKGWSEIPFWILGGINVKNYPEIELVYY